MKTPTEQDLSFIYLLFKYGFLPTEVREVFRLAKRLFNMNLRMSNDYNWTDKDDIKHDKLKTKLHELLKNIRHELGNDPRYYTVLIYRYDKDEQGLRI